jgi:hypothetical protein
VSVARLAAWTLLTTSSDGLRLPSAMTSMLRCTVRLKSLTGSSGLVARMLANSLVNATTEQSCGEEAVTMRYVGAIDQGTTSSRFVVVDENGTFVAMAQMEHEQVLPKPGWVEHSPDEIWQNTETVIRKALGNAGLAASDLAGVGITNQRETAVVWERASGEAVANAIVWQDTRSAAIDLFRRPEGPLVARRAS